MAPTRWLEHDAAQHSSSSEEEEESSHENGAREDSESEEEEEEEEEDKTSPPTPPKDKNPSALKKPEATQTSAQTPQSSSSDESGSESDSDPNIESISSKPMEDTPKATKQHRSKPSASALGTVKRALEKKSHRESKAAKKTGDYLFQRLWSKEDEIAVLKDVIQYTAKRGSDPLADTRRLKKKHENNASKGKKGGQQNITKPREQKAYDLSKKIYGAVTQR